MTEPSLSDDEATLAGYALDLADAIERALPAWFDRCIGRHVSIATWRDSPAGREYVAAAQQAVTATAESVRALLELDIGEQTTGPLELLRRAVNFPTTVLNAEGAPPVERDDFAKRTFPDDVYNLTPANFADVDESLHEPGLIWGAAKAHVHLRRRREQDARAPAAATAADQGQDTVVLCTDLMDRSKIAAAFPDAAFVRNLNALKEAAGANSLVLVDLRRLDDVDTLREIKGRVIAFGSHVDDETLVRAEEAGAESLARSVFFKRIATRNLL